MAHGAVDGSADAVMGHGLHQPLVVGFYEGKPVLWAGGAFRSIWAI
jgi:hypothetical protein